MAIRTAFILVAAIAAFAAAPLRAAKPPTSDDGAVDVYRERGIALCVAESRIAGELSGDDLKAICGCAIDRFVEVRGVSALQALGTGLLRGAIASELTGCTAELRPERARDTPSPGVEAKPPAAAPAPAEPAAAAPEGAHFDPGAWLRALDLRGWLAAVPAWAWVALGFLALLLLGARFRGRDDRRHLLGPPPSMRRAVSPQPRSFRLEL